MLDTPHTTTHVDIGPTESAPCARKAKDAPRRTMPTIAIVRGTYKARANTPNVTGKAVNRPVIMKISQTWFASQTGPIASATAARCSWARGPVANRSQTPPPKSAPARTAYAVSASQRMPATSSALLIRDSDPLVRFRVAACSLPSPGSEHEQQLAGRDRQTYIDDDEDRERQAEPGRCGRSL